MVLYWERCRAQEEEKEEMGLLECLMQWKEVFKEGEKPWEKPSSVHIVVDLLEVSFKNHKEIMKIYLVNCVKPFQCLNIICRVLKRDERVHKEMRLG